MFILLQANLPSTSSYYPLHTLCCKWYNDPKTKKYVKNWKKINHYCHRPIYKQRNYLNLPKWNDGQFYFSFDEISPIKWHMVDINPPLLHPLLWCQASIGFASNHVVLNLQEGMIRLMVFIWTKPKATKDGTTSTMLTKI